MRRFTACSIVLLFALCASRAGAAGFQALGDPGTRWPSEASRWVTQGNMVGLDYLPESTPLATAGPIRKAIAEDCTWNNDAGDNDGNNPDNWSLNHVPGNDEVARFDDTSPDESCTFSGNLSCEGMAATADYGSDINLGANDFALGSMGLVLDHTGGFDCGSGNNFITDGPFDNRDVGGIWTAGTAGWTFSGSGDITGHHLQAVDQVTFATGSHYRIHEDTDSRFSVNTECQVLGDLTLDDSLAFYGDCDATVADGVTFDGDSTLCLYDSRASHGLVSMGANVTFLGDAHVQVHKSVAGTRLGAGTYGCLVDVIGAGGNDTLLQLDHGSYGIGTLRLRNDSTGTVTLDNSANGPPSITVEGNLTLDNSDVAGTIVIDDSGQTVDWNIKADVVTAIAGTNFTWTAGNGTYYVNGGGNQRIDCGGVVWPDLTIDKQTSGDVELVDVDLTLASVNMEGNLTITSGDIDVADGATIAIDGDLTISGNNWDMGENTEWRIGGSLDYSGLTGTLTPGTSHLIMTGTGNIAGRATSDYLGDITIAEGAEISHTADTGSIATQQDFIINGTLLVETGSVSRVYRDGKLHLGPSGRIGGDGRFYIHFPYSGGGIITKSPGSVVDIRVFDVRCAQGGSTYAAGIYDPEIFNFHHIATCTNREIALGAGQWVFERKMRILNTYPGGFLFDNSQHNPDIECRGDVEITNTSTDFEYRKGDGQFSLTGSANQNVDIDEATTIEPITIDKPTSGNVELICGNLTLAAVDMAGDLTITSGHVDTAYSAMMTVGGDLCVGNADAATLALCNQGSLSVAGGVQLGPTATLGIAICATGQDLLRAAGNVDLAVGTTLTVEAIGKLDTIKDQTIRIVTADGGAGVTGTFTNVPQVGDFSLPSDHADRFGTYLGNGAWFGNDKTGEGVIYVGDPGLVTAVDITVFQAKPGDCDGDRTIAFADFNDLANNYTGALPPGTGGKEWRQGDFNSDHDVDFGDFNDLANNYTGAGVEYAPGSSPTGDPSKAQPGDAELIVYLANVTGADGQPHAAGDVVLSVDGSLDQPGTRLNGYEVYSAGGSLIPHPSGVPYPLRGGTYAEESSTGIVVLGSLTSPLYASGRREWTLNWGYDTEAKGVPDLEFFYGTSQGVISGNVLYVVPEPGTLVMLCGVMVVLLGSFRRRWCWWCRGE